MKKITFVKQRIFFIALFCAVNFGFGQIIWENPITGTNPQSSNPYITGQTLNTNITVSGIGRGSGIATTAVTADRYNADGWNSISLDANDYFYFTITPNPGYSINFTNLQYTYRRSPTGPTSIAIRSSLSNYSLNIGAPTIGAQNTDIAATINLSAGIYQNITSAITFRIYAWNGTNAGGTFSINDFIFNGTVAPVPCTDSTTWNGTTWSNGLPNSLSKSVTISSNYNTSSGNIAACSLTVTNGATLNITDNTHAEVQNSIVVDAGSTFLVQPYGAVVQINNTGTVTNNGTMSVTKKTAPMAVALEYTYWSSPVFGETIANGLFEANANRRFKFNALNFLDAFAETANNGAAIPGQDDIDDNGDDWEWVSGATTMQPGVGYASTHDPSVFVFAGQYDYTFEGRFNTGTIPVNVYRNDGSTADKNWNFIGNPYPSAISASSFFTQNTYNATTNTAGTLEGAIYYWSQFTAPSSTANGNQALNFAASDYATYNGTMGAAGGDGVTPTGFIPSGQGFFVSFSQARPASTGTVVFNNAMRVKGATNNSQFFKNSNTKGKTSVAENRLWINLTSDNGVFNQTAIGYVNGATNDDDGMFYDADKNLSAGTYASLYSLIDNCTKKFVIQGKDANSLNENETFNLGFKTSITVATLYKLSVAQLEGDFLTGNTIYLRDHLLNTEHNLSASDYTFTSEVGEFNSRFEIAFTAKALSTNGFNLNENTVKITSLDANHVSFKASNNLNISTVSIYDMLGRALYTFKSKNNEETYRISNLNNTVIIAKIELSNGAVITKKAILK